MNVSIPQLADLLIERTQNSSWVVSFKSLITIHHLMCFGNEVLRRKILLFSSSTFDFDLIFFSDLKLTWPLIIIVFNRPRI